jgi:hypothetical protein
MRKEGRRLQVALIAVGGFCVAVAVPALLLIVSFKVGLAYRGRERVGWAVS